MSLATCWACGFVHIGGAARGEGSDDAVIEVCSGLAGNMPAHVRVAPNSRTLGSRMEICREFHDDRDITDADHPVPMNVYANGGLLPEVVLEAGGEGASSVDGSTIISELYF